MPKRSRSQELLDFEITFYEKLVSAYPDFIDALTSLAHAYTRRGRHEHGLAIDLRLTKLRGHDPLTWYNLACSYALLNRIPDALNALRRSFELGYKDLAFLSKDPDLANLRRSPKFRELVESLASGQRT